MRGRRLHDSDADAWAVNSDPYACTINSDPHACTINSDPHACTINSDPHAYIYTYADGHSHTYSNTDGDPHAWAGNGDGHACAADSDPYARDADSNSYRDSHADTWAAAADSDPFAAAGEEEKEGSNTAANANGDAAAGLRRLLCRLADRHRHDFRSHLWPRQRRSFPTA